MQLEQLYQRRNLFSKNCSWWGTCEKSIKKTLIFEQYVLHMIIRVKRPQTLKRNMKAPFAFHFFSVWPTRNFFTKLQIVLMKGLLIMAGIINIKSETATDVASSFPRFDMKNQPRVAHIVLTNRLL